jgi:ABC-type spermidine/putrescine transport system permease subunit I
VKTKVGPKAQAVLDLPPLIIIFGVLIPIGIVLVGVLALVYKASAKYPKVKEYIIKARDAIFMNMILRSVTIAYLNLLVTSKLSQFVF